MDKTYQPERIEQAWYKTWEEAGHFRPSGEGESFAMVIPPPNVTGSLHMGHAFQDTIMDTLVRYRRMQGRNTLWQVGTDHAGIATQMVVERRLAGEGTNRHELGREKFLEKVWEWKGESGGTITRQLRRMGASVDWSRECFTMDEGFSRAVREVFVRLHKEDLIYRGKRLVNWDPALHTAISDLEVENREEQGHLWHFRYPLADGSGHLVVATTRPETMLGDTAVAVHPEDPRYKDLVGQMIRLPLADRDIPIIADDYVDPDFGSGCVKITPAHDFNDYEMGKRHDLPMINLLTDDAHLNDEVPEAYRGLERFEARKRVVDDLDALGLLEKVEDHTLQVPAATAPAWSSNPTSPTSGSWPWRAWPNPPSRRWRTAPSSSCRKTTRTCTSPGCATFRTGASPGSCGGGIASPPGTTPRAISTWAATRPRCAPRTIWATRR